MALGILAIIFAVLIIAAAGMQLLLYRASGDKSHNKLIFNINVLLGIIISMMAFTALPSNYMLQKVIAAAWGIIAVLAIFFKGKGSSMTSKLMLTISILGGLAQLIFA